MKIQVRINEEGALRNQRFAFTDLADHLRSVVDAEGATEEDAA